MEARWPEREAGHLHPPSAEVEQAYVWIGWFFTLSWATKALRENRGIALLYF
jgi:hypothetical protein